MALITKVEDELKVYCAGVSVGINITSITPSIEAMERKYIKPELGTAQYEALVAAYEDSIAQSPTAMSAAESNLWTHCVRALANLAVWHYAAANAAEVNDAGQRERNGEDSDPVRLWVANLQRDTYFETGMDEIENLLAFLDENKTDYPDWVAGTGYAGLKSALLQTTTQFNEYVHINSSRKLFKMLKPTIRTFEFLELRRHLSPAFYNRLLAGLQADDLTTEEQTAVNMLLPVIAHGSIARCDLPLMLGSAGAYYINQSAGNNTSEKAAATDSFTNEVKRSHEATAKQYLAEAIQYLNETADGTTLEEYFNSNRYQDPTETSYTDLGDDNANLNTIYGLP